MSVVRWGILSTSRHATKTWIPALAAAPSAELVAVASRDEERARAFAEAQGIPTAYGSYEALLAAGDIDAVYIPLPNHLHKPWTLRAAEAGKHVLCEKPLALNAAEAEEMVTACRAAGVHLMEAFQWRHHAQAHTVRSLVREGRIGALRMITASFSFTLTRPDDVRWRAEWGGGSLYDLGCYPVAVARFVVGAEPLSVTAQARWRNGVDVSLVGTLRFPGDVLAHIDSSFEMPLRRFYDVIGAEGSLRVERAYNPTDAFRAQILHLGADREPLEAIDVGATNSYTRMIEDFSRAILEGHEPPYSGEDGVRNMRVIDALYHAAREGGTVEVGA